jgi:16S rRNA A1518/A1519 N6-dimethyltransferase RsmA/KsgA/DIM1 with predicted DNA glycosylase/AP lyase activity
MPIIIDPESHELDTLLNCYPFRHEETVLEIGSGDGRMTWTYVDKVAHVTAIEPDADKHAAALADRPAWLKKIEFINLGLDAFVKQNRENFDLAILSWSL